MKFIFFGKKKLKNSKISVAEDLTKQNYNLLKECQIHIDKRNIWTMIQKHKIKNVEDLMKLFAIQLDLISSWKDFSYLY